MIRHQPPSVISVREVREKPEWMCALNEAGNLSFPFPFPEGVTSPLYILNGAVYVVHTGEFLKNHLFKVPETKVQPMFQEHSIDIDTQEDWLLAEFVLRKKLVE